MAIIFHYKKLLPLLLISFILYSCGSSKQYYNPYEVETLSKKLNIPLDHKDKTDDQNIPLYVQCSTWIGTRYKYGGDTKKGTDCSGMTKSIYWKVYRKNLSRSSKQLYKDSRKISMNKAEPGDLVFFATTKKKKEPTHVGIYLKNNKFIHASTSRGVIVSDLDEPYYKKAFLNIRKIK